MIEDLRDDATFEELCAAIDALNEDEVIDLIALAWVGRGNSRKEQWREARKLARERHRPDSAAYLVGMPCLGDYLEEGMAVLVTRPLSIMSSTAARKVLIFPSLSTISMTIGASSERRNTISSTLLAGP